MKRSAFIFALLLCCSAAAQEKPLARPHITGVVGMRLFAANLEETRQFYGKILGLPQCRTDAALCFQVNMNQRIEFEKLSQADSSNRLVHVAFETNNVTALLKYMEAKGIKSMDDVTSLEGTPVLDCYDPDSHVVEFVQNSNPMTRHGISPPQVSSSIIHIGFVVKNRPAMDKFYKDILGFSPYWHGGMKDDKDDWVAMQVPDGTDWVEYMLNIPVDANHKLLGVMNHIALGVPNIQAAKAKLIKNGWKPSEEPKIGRDGKWQLNVYDPDQTRIEFMEFTPVQKPCCSDFTGPHPKP